MFNELSQNEEIRRQISCLQSFKQEEKQLSLDELEDSIETLTLANRINDQKSVFICLDLIQNQAPLKVLLQISSAAVDIFRDIEQ